MQKLAAHFRGVLDRIRNSDVHTRDVAIHADLVDHLHADVASVIGGVAGGMALAWISHRSDPDGPFLVMFLLMATVGLFRITTILHYKRHIRGRLTARPDIRRWEWIYGAGAWSFAALLGVFCVMVSFDPFTDDLRTLTTAATVGYAGGIAGRNAGRPIIALGQVLLACVPVAIVLTIDGEPMHLGLALLLAIYTATLFKIVISLNRIVAKAFVKERVVGLVNDRLDAAITHMMNGLCMVDADGRIQVLNDRFKALLPLSESDPKWLHELLLYAVASGTIRHDDMEALQVGLATRTDVDLEIMTMTGAVLAVRASVTPHGGQIITLDDITERTRAAADIERMARTDSLTGLANRAAIVSAINEGVTNMAEAPVHGATRSPRRRGASYMAVLLIDLDRFKEVNDTLGHDAGDLLLTKVAQRLSHIIRAPDVVGRLGGDEFVVLHFDSTLRQTEVLAARIVKVLSKPFRVGRHKIHSGASIGIAMAPLHGHDAAGLMKSADIALYARKGRGRNGFEIFDSAMAEQLSRMRQLEADLALAVKAGAITQAYQPIVSAETGEIVAVEVLARWNNAQKGAVSPDVFIRLAESTGLIGDLGSLMLISACQEAARWPAHIRVSVNVSTLQFKDRNRLFDSIERALRASGLPPERLDLEVTESVLIDDAEGMLTLIGALKARGISISLDDFGTGYSSLSYVQKYPFDRIKLDRAFAKSIEEDRTVRATIAALANIAAATGSRLLLEGVESEAQAKIAIAHGVNELQGYHFGAPMTAEKIRLRLGVADQAENAA